MPMKPVPRARSLNEESEFARLAQVAIPARMRAAAWAWEACSTARWQSTATGFPPGVGEADQTPFEPAQFSPRRGPFSTDDLDAEMERLYHDHVAAARPAAHG